jgi:ATP-binding cassette, subfamily F, member 3
MSVLRLDAVRREIGTFVILDSISAALAAGERVGLVGANGAGKTTLLRIAAGVDEADSGAVHRKRGLQLGLLGQEANLEADFIAASSLRAAVRAGARATEGLERELRAIESAGGDAVATSRYAEVRERFDALEGYRLDQRVEETLSGLGFAATDWERPPSRLSGGEQTRAALARLLISDPELLLLDEPTNHLDLAALEWLEQALARRKGTLLVASHDRAFLDAVVTRMLELRDRRIESFRGNYSAYLLQREMQDARLRKEAQVSRESAAREQELVQVYRSHRKYSKMHEHEKRLAKLDLTEAPRESRRIRLHARGLSGNGPTRSGDLVVSVADAVVGFTGGPPAGTRVPVARTGRLEARRGDRIGLVGPNGAGKTTLLRTIAGELPLLDGSLRIGASVQPAYLAQLRRMAFAGETVLDALFATAPVDPGPARSYLARFLFRGEDVNKPVALLSGGERSRLELALIGVRPANLLLLDEPTNHLDIPAREALESFLGESPATLLVVSHDRRLLETVCDRLWVVEAGTNAEPGIVAPFDGTYREWRAAVADGWSAAGELERRSSRVSIERRPRRAVGETSGDPQPLRSTDGRSGAGSQAERERSRRDGVAAREVPTVRAPKLSKDAYRRQKQVVEADLTRLGLRKNHLELALGDRSIQANFVELRRLASELADVHAALSEAEDAWLTLEERSPR